MRRLFLAVLFAALPLGAETTVTLLHFSDYHSHALPFYTDEGERGGVARAVRYLAREKKRGALVFNGGDTINKGAPAWSDKYTCAEWRWWNGIVDAMAFGNHDADYGLAAYETCARTAAYPVLGANVPGFRRYAVFTTRGVRIGVFAVAGPDFPSLVKVEGLTFGDSVAVAREAVRALREQEHVDAVVMIGHEHAEADEALARAVPGIDLIFGTHSHLKRELTRIDGTPTWFISPWQYLAYISRVELTFDRGKLTRVRGNLVPVDERMPEDKAIARRVRAMEAALETDPQYRELFATVAHLDAPLSVASVAEKTLDAMRGAASADVALSTVSSFRGALPRGAITLEQLRAALPYDNEIVVCEMSGAALQRVLDSSKARAGSDSEAFVSGVIPSAARDPLRNDESRSVGPERSRRAAQDDTKIHRVATTDYLANVAYRDVFDCAKEKTGKRVREVFRATLSP